MRQDQTEVRLVVEAVVDAVEPYGFCRELPRLTVPDDDLDYIAASWLRGRDDRLEHYNCDGIAVWAAGYITVGLAGGHIKLHWRDLPPAAITQLVEAILTTYDRICPPE